MVQQQVFFRLVSRLLVANQHFLLVSSRLLLLLTLCVSVPFAFFCQRQREVGMIWTQLNRIFPPRPSAAC